MRRLEIDPARHQRGVLRHEHVLEDQRARDGAAHAQRIPVADHGDAVGFRGDREIQRIAARGLFAFGDFGAEHAVIIGVARKRGKNLLAVDDPAALDRLCLGAERDAAGRRRAAFRERLRIDRAVLDDAPVMHRAARLVFGAGRGIHLEIVGERTRPQRRADMHVPGQRGGAAIAADLGGRDGVGLIVGAEAAMLFRDRDAEQAGAVQVLVILGGKFGVAVVGRGAAGEHGLAELARGRDDRGLFIAEAKRLGIEDRRVRHRNGSGRRNGGLHGHASDPLAGEAMRRKSSSTALNSAGCSSATRCPTPSSST